MSTLVIVGAQWGDEAKGKMVDVLGAQAQVVVRYAGGNNAGHTVIVGNKTFKFQLIPAGILHRDTVSVLGSGMVICPEGFLDELQRTQNLQPELGTLYISASAHVVFPYHRLLDRLEEDARGENKIGTTSRGIGPAYQDKVARTGIRMGEFVDKERFPKRLKEVLDVKNRLLELFGEAPIAYEPLLEQYSFYADKIRPFVMDAESVIATAVKEGKRVLFEGAQGTFLDLDCGTYPYVTSSHPIAGGACLGTGIGPRDINHVLGVCKAYTTRVGSGPFVSELHGEIGEVIRTRGHEFGTVTGRGRRCGWLDVVALRQSAQINSLSGWVLTRLDVLGTLKELKIATGYRSKTGEVNRIPSQIHDIEGLEPIYESHPGWDEEISECKDFNELPRAAQDYVRRVEFLTGVPVAILSIGPDRTQTLVLRPDLVWSDSNS